MRHLRTLARKYFELPWRAIRRYWDLICSWYTHGPFGELNFGPLVLEIYVVWMSIFNSSCTDYTLRISKSKSVSVCALEYLGWDTRVSNRQCTWWVGFLRRGSTGQAFFKVVFISLWLTSGDSNTVFFWLVSTNGRINVFILDMY